MRLKLAISALMAAMLLVTTCASSVCEAQCDTRVALPSCHAVHNAISDDMASMAGMSKTAALHALTASLCTDHACIRQPASQSDSSRPRHYLVSNGKIATAADTFPAAYLTAGRNVANETPPPLRPSPVILHTILRL